MNNESQHSSPQHPSVDPTEGTGMRAPNDSNTLFNPASPQTPPMTIMWRVRFSPQQRSAVAGRHHEFPAHAPVRKISRSSSRLLSGARLPTSPQLSDFSPGPHRPPYQAYKQHRHLQLLTISLHPANNHQTSTTYDFFLYRRLCVCFLCMVYVFCLFVFTVIQFPLHSCTMNLDSTAFSCPCSSQAGHCSWAVLYLQHGPPMAPRIERMGRIGLSCFCLLCDGCFCTI
jgi:hypothetical protein